MRCRLSCRNNSIISGCCMKIFQNIFDIVIIVWNKKSISVTARSNSWVCGLSLVGIAGSNPDMRHGCLL